MATNSANSVFEARRTNRRGEPASSGRGAPSQSPPRPRDVVASARKNVSDAWREEHAETQARASTLLLRLTASAVEKHARGSAPPSPARPQSEDEQHDVERADSPLRRAATELVMKVRPPATVATQPRLRGTLPSAPPSTRRGTVVNVAQVCAFSDESVERADSPLRRAATELVMKVRPPATVATQPRLRGTVPEAPPSTRRGTIVTVSDASVCGMLTSSLDVSSGGQASASPQAAAVQRSHADIVASIDAMELFNALAHARASPRCTNLDVRRVGPVAGGDGGSAQIRAPFNVAAIADAVLVAEASSPRSFGAENAKTKKTERKKEEKKKKMGGGEVEEAEETAEARMWHRMRTPPAHVRRAISGTGAYDVRPQRSDAKAQKPRSALHSQRSDEYMRQSSAACVVLPGEEEGNGVGEEVVAAEQLLAAVAVVPAPSGDSNVSRARPSLCYVAAPPEMPTTLPPQIPTLFESRGSTFKLFAPSFNGGSGGGGGVVARKRIDALPNGDTWNVRRGTWVHGAAPEEQPRERFYSTASPATQKKKSVVLGGAAGVQAERSAERSEPYLSLPVPSTAQPSIQPSVRPSGQPSFRPRTDGNRCERGEDGVDAPDAAADSASRLDALEGAIIADLEKHRQRFWFASSPKQNNPSQLRSGAARQAPALAPPEIAALRARIDARVAARVAAARAAPERNSWERSVDDIESGESDASDGAVENIASPQVMRSMFPPSPHRSRHQRAHDSAAAALARGAALSRSDGAVLQQAVMPNEATVQRACASCDASGGVASGGGFAATVELHGAEEHSAMLAITHALALASLLNARSAEGDTPTASDASATASATLAEIDGTKREGGVTTPRVTQAPAARAERSGASARLAPAPHAPQALGAVAEPTPLPPSLVGLRNASPSSRRAVSRVSVNRHGSVSISCAGAPSPGRAPAAVSSAGGAAKLDLARELMAYTQRNRGIMRGALGTPTPRAPPPPPLPRPSPVPRRNTAHTTPTRRSTLRTENLSRYRDEMRTLRGTPPASETRRVSPFAAVYEDAEGRAPWSPPGESPTATKALRPSSPAAAAKGLRTKLQTAERAKNAAKRREHEANRRARERAANDERRLERAEERRERELFAAAEARAQELAAAVTEKERALAQQGAEHAEELDRLRAQIAAARIAAPVASRTSVALALQRELHATGPHSGTDRARAAAPPTTYAAAESIAQAADCVANVRESRRHSDAAGGGQRETYRAPAGSLPAPSPAADAAFRASSAISVRVALASQRFFAAARAAAAGARGGGAQGHDALAEDGDASTDGSGAYRFPAEVSPAVHAPHPNWRSSRESGAVPREVSPAAEYDGVRRASEHAHRAGGGAYGSEAASADVRVNRRGTPAIVASARDWFFAHNNDSASSEMSDGASGTGSDGDASDGEASKVALPPMIAPSAREWYAKWYAEEYAGAVIVAGDAAPAAELAATGARACSNLESERAVSLRDGALGAPATEVNAVANVAQRAEAPAVLDDEAPSSTSSTPSPSPLASPSRTVSSAPPTARAQSALLALGAFVVSRALRSASDARPVARSAVGTTAASSEPQAAAPRGTRGARASNGAESSARPDTQPQAALAPLRAWVAPIVAISTPRVHVSRHGSISICRNAASRSLAEQSDAHVGTVCAVPADEELHVDSEGSDASGGDGLARAIARGLLGTPSHLAQDDRLVVPPPADDGGASFAPDAALVSSPLVVVPQLAL